MRVRRKGKAYEVWVGESGARETLVLTTHNHNQAHSKQRTTRTQKHDMLPQHQS